MGLTSVPEAREATASPYLHVPTPLVAVASDPPPDSYQVIIRGPSLFGSNLPRQAPLPPTVCFAPHQYCRTSCVDPAHPTPCLTPAPKVAAALALPSPPFPAVLTVPWSETWRPSYCLLSSPTLRLFRASSEVARGLSRGLDSSSVALGKFCPLTLPFQTVGTFRGAALSPAGPRARRGRLSHWGLSSWTPAALFGAAIWACDDFQPRLPTAPRWPPPQPFWVVITQILLGNFCLELSIS